MKTKTFLKNMKQTAAGCLFATTMTMIFTACSDDEMEKTVTEEPQQLTMKGLGANADTYNINDDLESFTASNWREQEAIFIYDNAGRDYPEHDAALQCAAGPKHQGQEVDRTIFGRRYHHGVYHPLGGQHEFRRTDHTQQRVVGLRRRPLAL